MNNKKNKDSFTFKDFVEISVLIFICYLLICIIKYPWLLKDTDGNSFSSGIIMKDYVLKSKYELISYGYSIECLGGYSNFKLKNNESLNLDKEIMVCK